MVFSCKRSATPPPPAAYRCRACSRSLMMLVCSYTCVSVWMFACQHLERAACACCAQHHSIHKHNTPSISPSSLWHSLRLPLHLPSFFLSFVIAPSPCSDLLFCPSSTHQFSIPPPSFSRSLPLHLLLCFPPHLPLSLPIMPSSSLFISSSLSPFLLCFPPLCLPVLPLFCQSPLFHHPPLLPPSLPSLFPFLPASHHSL